MKKWYLHFALIILLLFCNSTKEEKAQDYFFYLVQASSSDGSVDTSYQSVYSMEKHSLYNYSGTCYDSFYGIHASEYYTSHGGGLTNTEVRRELLATKSCADMGYSGGILIETKEGLRMKYYTCATSSKACSATTIKQAGFM